MRYCPVLIRSEGKNLVGVLHKNDPQKIIILSHGFTGNKSENGRFFVTTAHELVKAGFSVLRFDFMGSGDSEGEFYEMSPNTEIQNLKDVIHHAQAIGYGTIGLLGLSFGGAVTICTAAQSASGTIQAMVTWSAVPSFKTWRRAPEFPYGCRSRNPCQVPGKKFFTDRPQKDVEESYLSLRIPKLQIQGDMDLPGFREEFSKYFPSAPDPKEHLIIPGADHVFTNWKHRKLVIARTVLWFRRWMR